MLASVLSIETFHIYSFFMNRRNTDFRDRNGSIRYFENIFSVSVVVLSYFNSQRTRGAQNSDNKRVS